MHEHFDLIIVGAGPAGLTAAVYARRAGRSVLVLERSSIGGQIASAPKVENYPGFSAISGAGGGGATTLYPGRGPGGPD